MQLANCLHITSLDQLLDHGGVGHVALGFYTIDVLRNVAVQNSLHTHSHFYMTPSNRPSECSTKPLWSRGLIAKRSCCPVVASQTFSATAFSIKSGRNNA